MARKPKRTTLVDSEGYESDGIYRWGGDISRDELQRRASEFIADCRKPADQRLLGIRAWLTDVVWPYIDGPYTADDLLSGKVIGWVEHLTLSCGKGLYRIKADRKLWQEDAIDALRENYELQQLLAIGEDQDSLIRLSIRQGQFIERILVRANAAQYAMFGKCKSIKSLEQAKRTNEILAEKRPDYCKAVRAMMASRKISYIPACEKVAEQFNVTPRTVWNNTKELRPGGTRK